MATAIKKASAEKPAAAPTRPAVEILDAPDVVQAKAWVDRAVAMERQARASERAARAAIQDEIDREQAAWAAGRAAFLKAHPAIEEAERHRAVLAEDLVAKEKALDEALGDVARQMDDWRSREAAAIATNKPIPIRPWTDHERVDGLRLEADISRRAVAHKNKIIAEMVAAAGAEIRRKTRPERARLLQQQSIALQSLIEAARKFGSHRMDLDRGQVDTSGDEFRIPVPVHAFEQTLAALRRFAADYYPGTDL